MNEYQDYFKANRSLWNKRTPIHAASDFYDLEAFKSGKSSLNTIELKALGDVSGKSLLHLQCHFGMDTLSWARLGARVIGVDLSTKSIELAKSLAQELQISARFICSNVYDVPHCLDKKFDIVFVSYGCISWLPDLKHWAEIIADFLKPGGIFYMVEFHPIVWMFDSSFDKIAHPYQSLQVIHMEPTETYTKTNDTLNYSEYTWNHGLATIIQSLITSGLTLKSCEEFDFSPYNCFDNMVKGKDGYWRIIGLEEKIPLLFSLKAEKANDI